MKHTTAFILLYLIIGVAHYQIRIIIEKEHTYAHEKAHEQIAEYFGCINHTTELNLFSDSSFKCLQYRNRTREERNMEYNLHGLNEIVSYNESVLIDVLFILSFLISTTIIGVGGRIGYKRRDPEKILDRKR